MKKIDEFHVSVESHIRNLEVVEKFLDTSDYEAGNSNLIRMEMNVIEFPIFTKSPSIKKNQVLRYYFSKDKKSYLEVTPPNESSIPNEFDERVFISLLRLMKKNGNSPIFYCSLSEIADSLNFNASSKRAIYVKIKNSVIKLSKTNYSFFNLFYKGELGQKVNDLINTPLLTSRIVTFKDADSDEMKLFSDKRIKEFYRIRIADDIYNNITNKGYLVFDADILLGIKDPVVRSLYTQITKWRHNKLYLKRPLSYLAQKIPLSWEGSMVFKSTKKILESFRVLKELCLITDFNHIQGKKVESGEIEVFFENEHNKVKQQLFYQDKSDLEGFIHSIEKKDSINNVLPLLNNDISNIIEIFGTKGQSLKTLPHVIEEALKQYDYEYVLYSAEYTMLNAKLSLLKYFKDTLANNWADEYIAKKKSKVEKTKVKDIEEAVIIDEPIKDLKPTFTWEDFEKLSKESQEEMTTIAYNNFLSETESRDNKTTRGIFEKTKKPLILKLSDEYLELKKRDNYSEENLVEPIKDVEKTKKRRIPTADEIIKTYGSIAKFTMELYLIVKKKNFEVSLDDVGSSLKLFEEYEDDYVHATFNASEKSGSYKLK